MVSVQLILLCQMTALQSRPRPSKQVWVAAWEGTSEGPEGQGGWRAGPPVLPGVHTCQVPSSRPGHTPHETSSVTVSLWKDIKGKDFFFYPIPHLALCPQYSEKSFLNEADRKSLLAVLFLYNYTLERLAK